MTTTTTTTRFEKASWLLENCPNEFINECTVLTELIAWMSEDQFNEFHEHICRNWNIDSPMAERDEEGENPMNDWNYVGSPDHY